MIRIRRLTFFLLLPCALWAQSNAHVDSLYSPSLGTTKSYVVIIPNDGPPSYRYPVLYLLHGYSGGYRDWIDRTGIEQYVSGLSVIVVMPDAGNSWYVNSTTVPSQRYEDYLMNDLLPRVESLLPIDTTRRAIAGLSMGGYGALVLAFRHPTMFRFAGSLSGALSVPGDIPEWDRHSWGKSIAPNLKQTFGSVPTLFWDKHDLFRLFRDISPDRLPYCYMVAGTHDGFVNFLPANRALADSLRAYGAAYEYHETPGGHNWKFWDREIQPLLKRMVEILKVQN